MGVEQREIVLIKFPFSDLSSNKVRPALIVSNNEFNNIGEDLLLIPITSVLKEVKYSIFVSNNNLDSGNLIVDSRLRIDKLTSLDKNMIVKKIGKVSFEFFEEVKEMLFECF